MIFNMREHRVYLIIFSGEPPNQNKGIYNSVNKELGRINHRIFIKGDTLQYCSLLPLKNRSISLRTGLGHADWGETDKS